MTTAPLAFHRGVLHVDGRPTLIIAGEYPYYRDRPDRWRAKLQAIRAAGVEVVTCYVPWRHHALDVPVGAPPQFCFASVDDNRNVVRFLELAHELGLRVIVKPGPFVHGEIQLGGLPDSVSPSHAPGREPSVSASGAPQLSQGQMLPSALSTEFLHDTQAWLQAVWERVVADRMYPRGPIVAVQVGNEGVYSDANQPAGAFDYGAAGARVAARVLASRYPTIDALNQRYGTQHAAYGDAPLVRQWTEDLPVPAALDGGAWLGAYVAEVIKRWSAYLGDVPKLLNFPPPARADASPAHARARLDAWLCRVRPRVLTGRVQYGFSSWVGVAAEDDEAFIHLAIAALRERGPNLEENWGLGWADARCAYAACTVYQALLVLACGATGYSIYPVCATDSWSSAIQLDQAYLARTLPDPKVMDPPYGELAPIDVDGAPAAKHRVLQLVNGFFAREGHALVTGVRKVAVALALYTPHAELMAWQPPASAHYKRLRYPQPAHEVAHAFVLACLDHGVEFGLVDLATASPTELARVERLVVPGGFYLDDEAQDRLADYVQAGGELITGWEVPLYDLSLQPSEQLQDRVFGHGYAGGPRDGASARSPRSLRLPADASPIARAGDEVHGYTVQRGRGRAHYLDEAISRSSLAQLFAAAGLAAQPVRGPDGAPAFTSLVASADDTRHLSFVLSRSDRAGRFRWLVAGHELSIALPRRGCAVVGTSVVDGRPRLTSLLVKAVNELHQDRVEVELRYGDDHYACAGGDVFAYRDGEAWRTELATDVSTPPGNADKGA
ncbi:MAG TPA: beta-galactosidase [Polyangiaceae bacterium]|nr:beta-galactosidase [Polyangiaceae bacterium]